MPKFDIEAFQNKWLGSRTRAIIDYAIKNDRWLTFEELFEAGHNAPIRKRKPSETRSIIKKMIIIGFLLADPQKGIKFNPNFTPVDQK